MKLVKQSRSTEKLTELASEPKARLAIDLAKTELIDSSGLGRLIECVTRSRMRGGHIVLVAPTPFVRGVLSVTHLDNWFEICDTIDDDAPTKGPHEALLRELGFFRDVSSMVYAHTPTAAASSRQGSAQK